MFCGKCGAQIADNATFCGNCGAPVTSEKASRTTERKPINAQQSKKIGLIAVAAVAVVVLVLLIKAISGGGGYQKCVKNLGKGIQNADARLVAESVLTGTVMAENMDDLDDDDWEEASEDIEEALESL